MNVQKVLTELTQFKIEVEKELKKIKDFDCNESNIEEIFLNVELMGIISDLSFAVDCINYINKPIYAQGILNIKGNKFFIDDFELRNFDTIEVLTDEHWCKIDIIELAGEYYAENLTSLIKSNNNLIGRIRLTKEDLINR